MSESSNKIVDREEVTRESDFAYEDEDEESEGNDWTGEVEWNDQDEGEGGADDDVQDESAAYLDFLSQEVRTSARVANQPRN